MNSDRSKDRSIPYIFFITTIIAYGLLLPKTGFYWDDWPFAWIARFFGPWEFIPAFDGVRPFLGPIFLLTTSLVPPVPIYWQSLALIIRFLAGLSAWFALSQVWSQHKQQMLVASLLFLVFPGYSQHWVAFTHINQEWIPLILYLLSFGFTAYALRHPSAFHRNTGIALVLLVPGVFPTEYFASIEPLRLFFIWAILSEQVDDLRRRIVRALKLWLPYFLVWMANALWLVYFYTLGNYESYDVEVAPESISLLQILETSLDALWKIGIYVWGQIVILLGRSITAPSSLLTLALIAAALIFFVFYLSRFQSSPSTAKPFAWIAVWIGAAGILLGRLPSFAAGLPLTLQSSNDRFVVSMMLSGSLFIVGIVELMFRHSRTKTYVFAVLIALSIGQQFFNANIFRRDWENQQAIFWQLAWRIPAMEPGTALLTDQLPIDYETDLSLMAPLNWMYAPDYTRSDLPYGLLFTDTRLGKASLPSLAPGTEIFMGMRSANFYGSTSQVIVIHKPENGCLRVLNPEHGDQITYDQESPFLLDAIPLSNLELIDVDSTQIPKLPFLSEPEHTWCYYFAKAELARQRGDWQRAVEMYDEATSLGYWPGDPFEWLVFIESQVMTGNIEGAQELSDRAIAEDRRVRRGVCQVWKRVQDSGTPRGDAQSIVNAILMKLECQP